MGDVPGFESSLAGNQDLIDAQALIDQKSHPVLIDASFRRVLRIGG